MTKRANRGYAMSETREIEENFEILKEMFIDSRQTVQLLEQQKAKLEKNVKILTDANKLIKESNDRLLAINDTQQLMLSKFDQSLKKIDLLNTELEKLKKENLKLKNSFNNKSVPNPHESTIENYNSLLQKKIVDLEKQLLQNQTMIKQKSSLYCTQHEKELSTLKNKNNGLFIENKSLKEQLTNFRALHHQIVSEIQLKNQKCANDGSQQIKNTPSNRTSPITIDVLNPDELRPIQVHIIDSDID